ncbi:MAG: G1 family glutamic endopeptidase [Solirubrobacteraceae bacterium]
MRPTRRSRRIRGSLVYGLAAALICAGPVTTSLAAPAKGRHAVRISRLSPAPAALPPSGGTVRLVGIVHDAARCRFASPRTTAGLPVAVRCANGRAAIVVRVPANASAARRRIRFELMAFGAHGARQIRWATVVEAAAAANPAVAPAVSLSPISQTIAEGASVTFTAAGSGVPAPAVQWQVSADSGANWADLSGATAPSYTFLAAAAENGYEYRAVFANATGSATTAPATLIVEPPLTVVSTASAPTVTTQPTDQTVAQGDTATFTAAASGFPAPTVQWQASTDGGTSWNALPGAPAASFSFTADVSETGYEYRASFSNSAGAATTSAATLTVIPASQAPAITLQPVDQGVAAGASVTFAASASGSPSPTVQWQTSTDGGVTWQNVPGAVSAGYGFVASIAQNGNEFRAVFTNSSGAATTTAATLSVTPAPAAPAVTLEPASQSVAAASTVTFSAAASGNPTPTAQWQVSTDGGGTWSDIAGATSVAYAQVAQIGESGDEYRATFTNTQGAAATSAATLTVIAQTSLNWSGYVATAGTFSAVSGSWTVPTATCPPIATSLSFEWVGIDGWTDGTVEQDGTETNCSGGTPTYAAWYEMFGDPSVNNGFSITLPPTTYPVAAGDSITASVRLVGSTWQFVIADPTAGWNFQTAVPSPTPAPAQSSAEWIAERPTVSGTYSLLTDFSAVTFTQASATANGRSGTLSSFSWAPIEMLGSHVLATPGSLNQTGDGFTDTWLATS